jgi:SMODS and SLOG-associating 2TM effector domain family 5
MELTKGNFYSWRNIMKQTKNNPDDTKDISKNGKSKKIPLYLQGKSKGKSKKLPLYLQGKFDKHLSYKLWSTSGARFQASLRLKSQHKLSVRAIGFLSAYVIILSLLSHMEPAIFPFFNKGIITILSVIMSIIILVVSLLEAGSDYSLNSYKFHQCGIKVSDLYKELRFFKDGEKGKKTEGFWVKVKIIDANYSKLLKQYENHDPIDLEMFKLYKPDYEDHCLTGKQKIWIWAKYYFKTRALYDIVVFIPLIVFSIALCFS